MPIWTFVDYVEASGRNPVAELISEEVPTVAKAAIDDRFLRMAGMKRWPDKWVSTIKGYPGILEARIPYNKVQYRPLFMYSLVVRWQIVLLSGAIEKGKIPKSTLDTANDRRQELIKEPARVRRHQIG
jgi:hypothetical protein